MSQKQIKKIRKLCKEKGLLKDPDYGVIQHERTVYIPNNKTGVPELRKVVKGNTLIDKNNKEYKQMKKMYNKGLFNV